MFAQDGSITRVVAVSCIDYNPDSVEVEFRSGEKIICDRNHLWVTMTVAERAQRLRRTDAYRSHRRGTRESRAKTESHGSVALLNRQREYAHLEPTGYTARTAGEIAETLTAHGEWNHVTPVCDALRLPDVYLRVEPYLLGLWLGDGTKGTGSVGMAEDDMAEVLEYVKRPISGTSYPKKKSPFRITTFKDLRADLREMGILNHKRIPREYLRASTTQRTELLWGLMDTDGSADGKCEITLASLPLLEDVQELLSTLGVKATIRQKQSRCQGKVFDAWRLTFNADFHVFKLRRKRESQRTELAPRSKQRAIVAVRDAEKVPMRCIQVEHPSGTYLLGRTMVVTHNSHLARSLIVELNGRLMQEGFPNPWGILFCKVGEDLKKRHLSKIEEELGSIGRITEDRKRGLCFRFNDENMGGVFLSHLEDADRLRSAEFAWAICDELTECTRDDFGRILYSIRSSKPVPHLPFIAMSNPDGPGHSWVRKLWIDRDFSKPDEDFDQDDFIYVKALPTDNPTWTEDMASSQFAGLTEHVRIARLTGSWDAIGNARFPTFDRGFHVFNFREKFPHGLPLNWRKYRAIDYGFGAPWCVLWAAKDGEGNFWVYRELYEKGVYAWEQAKRIKEFESSSEHIDLTYAGVDCWAKTGQQFGNNLSVAKYYADAGINMVPVNNDRVAGWVTVENYLDPTNGLPNVFIEENCRNLVRTLAALPLDNRSPILEKKGEVHPEAEDHAPEALRGLLHTYHHPSNFKVKGPGATASEQEIERFNEFARDTFLEGIAKKETQHFDKTIRNKASRRTYRRSWPGR